MDKRIAILSILLSVAALLYGGGRSEEQRELPLYFTEDPTAEVSRSIERVAGAIALRDDAAVRVVIQELPIDGEEVQAILLERRPVLIVAPPTTFREQVPDFAALTGPLLYRSFDEYARVLQSAPVQSMRLHAWDEGVAVISLDYVVGFRNLITNEIIQSLEDVRGLRLRVPEDPRMIATVEAMGATAVPTRWNEAVSATRLGLADGFEESEFTNARSHLYEVRGNVALTRHLLDVLGVFMAREAWLSLEIEDRNAIIQEFAAGAIAHR